MGVDEGWTGGSERVGWGGVTEVGWGFRVGVEMG